MKNYFTQRLLVVLIAAFGGVINAFAVGETITSKTVEGVTLLFEVTNDDPKECKVSAVFDNNGQWVSSSMDQTTTGKVTIPPSVMGYTVKEIGDYAFALCSAVEEIVIPQRVTTIGVGAFAFCSSLKKCWLPDDLETLGINDDGAGGQFTFCSQLTDVYLPHHITSIPGAMFSICPSLKHIEIPASVTSIGSSAFTGCSSLEMVSFLGSCPSFGTDVFKDTPSYNYFDGQNTGSLVQFVVPSGSGYNSVIPGLFNYTDAVYPIIGLENNHYGFKEHSTMGYMVNVVLKQGDNGYECIFRGAVEEVLWVGGFTLPERILGYPVTQLQDVTWENGSLPFLEKAIIPGTCRQIGSYNTKKEGFADCTALKEVEIQEGVSFIGYGAFANTALKELRLPKSLRTYYACVHNCPKLTDVYIPVFKLDALTNVFEGAWSSSQATLHVPYGASENYEGAVPKEFAKIEEDAPHDGDLFYAEYKSGKNMWFQIISVADNTCRVYGENKLNKTSIPTNTEGAVNIPQKARGFTVAEIGDFAFGNAYSGNGSGCGQVSYIGIPNTVKHIGEMAFGNCNNLVSVTVPNSVETIAGGAFWACKSLVNVTLPEGLTAIETMTFSSCPALESVNLPESITRLDYAAFSGAGIISIEIPKGVQRIESSCFNNCKKLESVVMHNGVRSIGWYGFKGCESLTSIDLPATLNEIDYQAFKNCPKLADVKIRSSRVNLINTYAPSYPTNEAFDLKTERYAELTVPRESFETYNQDPWLMWFSKFSYVFDNIPTSISGAKAEGIVADKWYTLEGNQLQTAPTKPGLYIKNGKKTMVK